MIEGFAENQQARGLSPRLSQGCRQRILAKDVQEGLEQENKEVYDRLFPEIPTAKELNDDWLERGLFGKD